MNIRTGLVLLAAIALTLLSCSKDKQVTTPASSKPSAPSNEVLMSAGEQQQAGVRVAPVELRSVPQVLHVTGRLALNENRTWRVGAVTDGRVVTVLANPGDTVRSGQVLARMHSHEIHESRAMYRKALADLSSTKQNEAYAQKVRDREKRLYELRAASPAQVESAETVLKAAQTATANAEVEVDRTRRHLVEFLDVALQDRDNEDGDLVPIRAPSAGVVLSRTVTPGTVLQPSTEAFVLSDLSSLWMIAAVSEEYLPKLRPGMQVQVFVRAYGNEPFQATIEHIGEVLDPTTRTVLVRIKLPNSGNKLKPEMYAIGDIALGGSEKGVFIPESAPQEVNGQKSVFVRTKADRFEVRPIEPGRTIEGALQVKSGLKEGDEVVTQGSFVLKSQLLKSSLSEGE
jgi:multidrug efflux pump subunit AcrA (membrane-fusion protein)